jgi:hypothetical protein
MSLRAEGRQFMLKLPSRAKYPRLGGPYEIPSSLAVRPALSFVGKERPAEPGAQPQNRLDREFTVHVLPLVIRPKVL